MVKKFILIFFALALVCPSHVMAKKRKASAHVPGGDVVDYVYAGFPVSFALCSAEDRQYVAYYDSLKQVTVAQRNLPDGPWKYAKLDSYVGWDSHNNLLMTVDSRGVLHLTGNMHRQPLNYFCTDESGDISTLRRVKVLVGDNEVQMTYPKFIKLQDGRLIFHYRTGASFNGKELYNVQDTAGNWSRYLETPLTDGQGHMNAYATDPKLGRDGYYHMAWVWRNSSDCSTNHDLSYARSRDLVHWTSVDGTPVELPITYDDECLLVDPCPVNGGMLNGSSRVGFDRKGRPVISYHKYDDEGRMQIFVARYENDRWRIAQITDWDCNWRLAGGGSIIRQLWVQTPHADQWGNLIVAYKRYDPNTGKRWEREIVLDDESLVPLKEQNLKSEFPGWFEEVYCKFAPDMTINRSGDTGKTSLGKYVLRWETLPANRDLEVTRPIPPAQALRVVKIK